MLLGDDMSKKLLKSTGLVSFMTAISRVLGFARDMVCAHYFGAYGGFDAFIVAFKIPNFMRRLFAEGAFAQAFVPVLSEQRMRKSPPEVQQFINNTSGTLALALLVVTVLAELLAPVLIAIFAPGFWSDTARFSLATDMLRVTFPYLVLISMTAYSGAVLNSFGGFGAPAFTPVLLNVAMIVAAVLARQWFAIPIHALAWGVFAGGVIQLLFLLSFLYRRGLLPRPRWGWHDSGVQRVLKLMVPALFGVSVAQIGLLLDTLFASFLQAGSISWLYYSQQLTFFPLGVFGVALATVVLPHLSRQHALQSKAAYQSALDWALRVVLVIALPASLGLFLMAGPLIATLFQSGKFDMTDVWMARQSLLAFSVGLPSFMLIKVLASAFYAKQDIRTPVRIAVVALIVNVVLNLLLILPLKHAGLALATSLSSSVNAILLLRMLVRREIFSFDPQWRPFLQRILFANVVMVGVLWFGVPDLSHWFEWGRWMRFAQLMLWIFLAMGSYVFALGVSGIRLGDFVSQVAE